jgi:hypothetical protein
VEDFFKAAASYAAMGWRCLRINGLRADGKTCTCLYGTACGTPGKHPVDSRWQTVATTDEAKLAEWFDGTANLNVGVALGRESGIVDIEWDDEAGKETAEKFGLHLIETPTYISHRSEHRIFRFDDRLPEQAVIKVGGLEVRIGGGGKGAQSVFPPSIHASGVRYRWKYGFSPDEVSPAEIPPELMQAIVKATNRDEAMKPPASEILHKKVDSGSRHLTMVRYIASKCVRMLDPHDPQEQQETLIESRAVNMMQCVPPLPDIEVENIWRGQIRWAIKVRAEGGGPEFLKKRLEERIESGGIDEPAESDEPVDCPFTLNGLEYRDGEWFPGRWRLKVVHNDPVTFILSIPVFSKGETKMVDVIMDAETYRSAAKVACAVLESTHTVILDAVPEEWGVIWCGSAAKTKGPRAGQPAVRGLKAKLMDEAVQEEATAENLRYAAVAGWMLDVLCMTPEPGEEEEEDGEPDASGRPSWVRSKDGVWELWFGWSRVWEDVDRRQRRLEEGDKLKIKKMLLAATGEKSFPVGRYTGDGGSTRRYIRFTGKHIRALEKIAAGDSLVNTGETRVSSAESARKTG